MAKFYKSYSRLMVEIDLPRCTRTYGVAPCTAAVGVTGADKCFNCIRTCQDRLNYNASTITLRLADQAPDSYYTVAGSPVQVINNIVSYSITPAIVKPGVDAGERETLTINCIEHADSDTILDPYVTERAYDPLKQGTFWQRLRSRYVSYEGFPLRFYRGYAGQDRDVMDVYHYSMTSITSDGKSAKLTAKDPFTLTDSKKSQAPVASNGSLLSALVSTDTSVTLTPSGVGDYEYPASGFVCLSGSEVVPFTRTADTLTITRDAAVATSHEAGAAVQLVLAYAGVSGATILADLLVNYTQGIDPAWVDSATWEAEINGYYGTLFTAKISAPTSVATLINEIIAQLPAVFFWDSQAQKFRLQALRPADPTAPLLDDNSFVENSFKVTEQPNARADMIWTYFGQKDSTKKLDEVNNYATTLATVDADSGTDYNTDSIKTVYSRWIPAVARGAAQILNATLLSRYRDPPRQVAFNLWRNILKRPNLGDIYMVTHPFLQDAYGAQAQVPVQLCTVKPTDSGYECSAQEIIYKPQTGSGASGAKYIYIDSNIQDVNLRTLYDGIFSGTTGVTEVHLVIGSGATVGGTVNGGYALEILAGDWPGTVDIFIDMLGGNILGKGGDGLANVDHPELATPPPAGHALHCTRAVTVTGTGIIGGGGGASARWMFHENGSPGRTFQAGGGGGAGYSIGKSGAMYAYGVYTLVRQAPTMFLGAIQGGSGASTYDGPVTSPPGFERLVYVGTEAGDLGVAGGNTLIARFVDLAGTICTSYNLYDSYRRIGTAGAAGNAIVGYSNLTIVGSGIDVRGATI